MSPSSQPHPTEPALRNPWSTEPELPPDGSVRAVENAFDPREALAELDTEARTLMTQLARELDELRPLLAVDAGANSAYVSAVRRLAAAEQTAVEVHAARRRLNEGTYGFCTACAEPIPTARLELRPHSRVCVPCT